ncbi:MAG TPA: NusA-like transcription termination signal-binding factor [Candidatus Nanoarchaeia archaeon]|nr:NusA-like transcription termination signal-binding factor [Candidatus Nanoarchaeia archaeon]
MTFTLDASLIPLISLFERETHARVRDCFNDAKGITFIVEQGDLGKAVGKQGMNVKRFENSLHKRVRIVEFNPDRREFILNMIRPLRVRGIEEQEDGTIIIQGGDTETKGLLIGRAAQNLRTLEEQVRRHYKVKEIKVV